MHHLIPKKMFVTMIPHSWQQTENYIAWKFSENVAIKVLLYSYLMAKNGKIQDFGRNF